MSHRQVPSELHTVCDTVRWAMSEMERFEVSLGHGTADYWEEATFLVLRTLKLPFDRLEAFWNARLTQDELWEVLRNIDARVHDKVPAAYLLKEAWLTGHVFYIDERALIPRSYIAELLEEDLAPWVADPDEVGSVLDLCTGSGCLAILAQGVFQNAAVTGADISPDALEVAKVNRRDYGMEDTLELVESDLFSNLEGRRFDLIITNPPYVTERSMAALPAEYRREPALALAAGPDGMDVVKRILEEAADHLTADGLLVVEVGDGLEAVEALYPGLPITWLSVSGGDDQVFLAEATDLRSYFHKDLPC